MELTTIPEKGKQTFDDFEMMRKVGHRLVVVY